MRLVLPAGTCLSELTMCCILKLHWVLMLIRVWKLLQLLTDKCICQTEKFLCVIFKIYLANSFVESHSPLGQSAALSAVPLAYAKDIICREGTSKMEFMRKELKIWSCLIFNNNLSLRIFISYWTCLFFVCATCLICYTVFLKRP